MKFVNCRTIYPLRIIRPLNKYIFPVDNNLSELIDEIHENSLEISGFMGDNPKRSLARCCLSHSSSYPCEYCFSKGDLHKVQPVYTNELRELSDKISSLQRSNTTENIDFLLKMRSDLEKKNKKMSRTRTVWPASTRNGAKRTKEEILLILESIDADDTLSKDDRKGVVSKSPFMSIEYFDFINHISVDYMHAICLGLVKKLIELCFSVGDIRPRITKRKLSSPNQYNNQMTCVKVPREFSRRGRMLDFSMLKAQEFRNIILFFFPLIISSLPSSCKEIQLWLLLSYSVRACILPVNEFAKVSKNTIKKSITTFYSLYEKLFGAVNCSYNTHVVCSHLLQMRYENDLTKTSCFPFENFYSELRHSFIPGTQAPLKQIFIKSILKRTISPHSCSTLIYLSNQDTALECNSTVYSFDSINKKYNIYQIFDIDDDVLSCHPIGIHDHIFKNETLDWGSVGVFRSGGISSEIRLIDKVNVHGKVIKINNLLITCPINVLLEK